MIASRSCTKHFYSTPITLGGTVLKECDALDMFGVTFDSKMILRSVFASFSVYYQRLGYLKKSYRVFTLASIY